VAVIGLAVLPSLVIPAFVLFRIGADLGEGLASPASEDGLLYWNGVQGVFTVLFALLGSFRFNPALSLTDFNRYPLTKLDLAMSELPAAVFEVFPLLGVAGIVATNAGLASRLPAMTPLVCLLTLLNVLGMLTLMMALASLWRGVMQRGPIAVLAGACLVAALLGAGWNGWMATLRESVPLVVAVISRMPGSYGYAGLVSLRSGQFAAGALDIVIALAGTLGLGIVAALAHHRALFSGAWARDVSRKESAPGVYRGPAFEVATLFFRQLARSRTLRLPMLLPLLMTGLGAFVLRELGRAIALEKDIPPNLVSMQHRLAAVPFLSIALILTVAMTSQIWMNQFGWDRSAIRALLHLPVAPRDILVGKFLGLLEFTLVGWAISTAGLLFFYRPAVREVIGGLAAAGVAFVTTCVVGQFVSIQMPRAVPRGGMAQMPIHVSWVPAAVLISILLFLAGLWTIGTLVGYWVGPLLIWGALFGAVLLWRAVLPQIERLFVKNREKLLSM
jgi:hypothetical protein